MIDYKKELNEEQLTVVENGDGPCLVLAGAGSGKTRTITYRVAHLLEQGVAPDEILLVTFTNKAAKEMVERLGLLTKGKTTLLWSGTFHRIAYRILRYYATALGYQQNFTILDSEDSRDILKLCVKEEGIDKKEKRFPSTAVIQSMISYSRNAGEPLKETVAREHTKFTDIIDIIERIADAYARRKRDANTMDFDDLLVNLHLLLLKSEAIRNKYASQFKYVLVDEYQDTNTIQASIVKLFASQHGNLLVVGDDAQSIYSFRAANIENILGFEKKFQNAKVHRLETNYRSTPNILNLANDVISHNVHQYEKHLASRHSPASNPLVKSFTDQQEEARFIVDQIQELEDEGTELNEIAVLFRAAFHSQALEIELTKRGIPYDYRGGVRFFARAHIKDVLAYIRIFRNEKDTVAWSRVLHMQVGLGSVTVQKIISKLQAGITIEAIAEDLPARAKAGWTDFYSIYKKMKECGKEEPAPLILAVLDSTYEEYLENEYPDYRERMQDLEQLALFAASEKDIDKFLGEASLQESYSKTESGKKEDDEEKLILSTIHQAKGLEWKSVFIINVSAGNFPGERSMKERKGLEEERRLFYVAVTRAKQDLFITYPLIGFGGSLLSGPSVFIEEMDKSLVTEEGALDNSTTSFFDPSDDVDDITYVSEDDQPRSSFLMDV